MSSTLRIALVAEGITDFVVLKAVIEAMLNGRSFDLKLLQPEESVAFTGAGMAGLLGGGWKGVYKWCRQSARRSGGSISTDVLFDNYDLLVLHLDADVAGEDPANYPITPISELAGHLPCEHACPPPEATTNPLRIEMLSWIGENTLPPRTILCTPSKSIEAWVIAAFFPNDKEMIKRGWECHPRPESRLAQQKLPHRFGKSQAEYEERRMQFQANWPVIAERLSEAARFQHDFRIAMQAFPA